MYFNGPFLASFSLFLSFKQFALGDDSCSKGCGFESWHLILDDFFTLICCKKCIVCLKRPKINEKETGVGPFFKQSDKISVILR